MAGIVRRTSATARQYSQDSRRPPQAVLQVESRSPAGRPGDGAGALHQLLSSVRSCQPAGAEQYGVKAQAFRAVWASAQACGAYRPQAPATPDQRSWPVRALEGVDLLGRQPSGRARTGRSPGLRIANWVVCTATARPPTPAGQIIADQAVRCPAGSKVRSLVQRQRDGGDDGAASCRSCKGLFVACPSQ